MINRRKDMNKERFKKLVLGVGLCLVVSISIGIPIQFIAPVVLPVVKHIDVPWETDSNVTWTPVGPAPMRDFNSIGGFK